MASILHYLSHGCKWVEGGPTLPCPSRRWSCVPSESIPHRSCRRPLTQTRWSCKGLSHGQFFVVAGTPLLELMHGQYVLQTSCYNKHALVCPHTPSSRGALHTLLLFKLWKSRLQAWVQPPPSQKDLEWCHAIAAYNHITPTMKRNFLQYFLPYNSLSQEGRLGDHTPEEEHVLRASPSNLYPSSHVYITILPFLVP